MIGEYKKQLLDRFLKYVQIDTQSDDSSTSVPSTSKQFSLAKIVEKELIDMGLSEVKLTEKCYLYATLASNTNKKVPVIGFIAHFDTSPDMSGKDVKPLITENYNGEDILLNKANNIVLSVSEFPALKNYKGQTIIATDGTTLLGADDKAGMAEIVTGIQYLLEHPEIEHGEIKIGFTPDEEIGKGADHFDVDFFGADFAYTFDSGEIGGLEYETFNAAMATITITGKNVHPGYAKGIMINAMHLAMQFNTLLPSAERPEHTANYEGFYHLIKMEGTVEKAELRYIIRDHDKTLFESRKKEMLRIADFINKKHNAELIKPEIKDQYYNMREKIEQSMHCVDLAITAYRKAGIEPKITPVRGGTDGARLSFMGLPTPNIFAGGHNFHSRFEFVPLESMMKAMEVLVNISNLNTE